MKEIIETILVCLIVALLLTGCIEGKPVNVNVENNTTIAGTVLGKSALIEIEDGLLNSARSPHF